MTLHEAIEQVLKEVGHPLPAKEIAYLINKSNLYIRKDMLPVPSGQIHARIRHYTRMFEKDIYGNIKLVHS